MNASVNMNRLHFDLDVGELGSIITCSIDCVDTSSVLGSSSSASKVFSNAYSLERVSLSNKMKQVDRFYTNRFSSHTFQ